MAAKQLRLQLKRAYEAPTSRDGIRVLVDRLWPRGVAKATAAIDHWMKDIAPSTELRRWFGHDPKRWDEFRRRYETELRDKDTQIEELRTLARKHMVTLVFAARDEEYNDAVVLHDVLMH
jgi:uncharacterized protein YeaO (DUF488 family)